MVENNPYIRDEILAADRIKPPDRGLLCPKCNTYIPQFADLTVDNTEHLKSLLRGGNLAQAIIELRNITDCSLKWATIWCFHPDGPREPNSNQECQEVIYIP